VPNVKFDYQRSPLVVIQWPVEWGAGELQLFMEEMTNMVRREERIAVLNDIRRTRAPTAAERKLIAAAVSESDLYFHKYVVGWADVSSSALIRGIVTAILWMNPSRYPHSIHGSVIDGEKWCRKQLKDAGVDVPAQAS
jgi:hypothetical protein